MHTVEYGGADFNLGRSSIHGPLPTSRQAWREVRDHTDREAETRRAFAEALKETTIRIMSELSTTQTRVRNRIKEDLEKATDVSGPWLFTAGAYFRVELINTGPPFRCTLNIQRRLSPN